MRALRSFIACVGLLLCIIAAQPAPRADFSGGCPLQAQQWFARAPGASANRQNYCNLIAGLVNAGIWQQLDALYIFAAPTQSVALTNLVSSSFGATAVNSPTFTAYRGFAGNGTTSYVNSNYNPGGSGSFKFTLNSANISIWDLTSRSASSSSTYLTGVSDGVHFSGILGGMIMGLSQSAAVSGVGVTTQGLWTVSRTSSAISNWYNNGVGLKIDNSPSTAEVNAAVYIGGRNNSGTFDLGETDQMAVFMAGGSLTAAQVAAAYAALHTYLHAVGAL